MLNPSTLNPPTWLPGNYFFAALVFLLCLTGEQSAVEGHCMTVATSDACYFVHEGSDTWWEAAYKCSGKEGHLVEFHTNSEFNPVREQISQHYDGIYYIGLMKLGTSPWFWYTTGKPMDVSRGFSSGEDYDTTARCMALDFRYRPGGSLKQVSCDERIGFICESPEKAIQVHIRRNGLLSEE